MDVKHKLIEAALALVASESEHGFSTRAACALAGVTAPTLYHHFGTADGLLSAAIDEAFERFLARKQALHVANDPVRALIDGWDDYVAFAAENPRLYGLMISRVLQGADIPAAAQARAILLERLSAISNDGRLRLAPSDAADLIWASAHAAAMLWVTARAASPVASVIDALRDAALRSLIDSQK